MGSELGERGSLFLSQADRHFGIPLTVPCAIWRELEKAIRHHPARDTKGLRSLAARTHCKVGIFCPGALGDAILLSALLGEIKRTIPKGLLEFTGSAANAAVLPLLPHLDKRFAIPIGHVRQIIAHLRERRYDVLIDASQWARIGAIVTALSGAGCTVGFRTPGQWRSLPYDVRVNHSPHCHEVYNFLALGQCLWPALRGLPHLRIPHLEEARNSSQTIFCHMWPSPGRGRAFKEWPETHWAELIDNLLTRGFAVALTGAAADAPGCDSFVNRYFPDASGISSWAGKVSLPILAAHFRQSTAVISVNTGILHLAAAVDAPTIGLHGATNPMRWGALGVKTINLLPEQGECAYLHLGFEYPDGIMPAMGHLRVQTVLQALERLGVSGKADLLRR